MVPDDRERQRLGRQPGIVEQEVDLFGAPVGVARRGGAPGRMAGGESGGT
jgi:hypothetical protein